jgi:hypothetical protein
VRLLTGLEALGVTGRRVGHPSGYVIQLNTHPSYHDARPIINLLVHYNSDPKMTLQSVTARPTYLLVLDTFTIYEYLMRIFPYIDHLDESILKGVMIIAHLPLSIHQAY